MTITTVVVLIFNFLIVFQIDLLSGLDADHRNRFWKKKKPDIEDLQTSDTDCNNIDMTAL